VGIKNETTLPADLANLYCNELTRSVSGRHPVFTHSPELTYGERYTAADGGVWLISRGWTDGTGSFCVYYRKIEDVPMTPMPLPDTVSIYDRIKAGEFAEGYSPAGPEPLPPGLSIFAQSSPREVPGEQRMRFIDTFEWYAGAVRAYFQSHNRWVEAGGERYTAEQQAARFKAALFAHYDVPADDHFALKMFEVSRNLNLDGDLTRIGCAFAEMLVLREEFEKLTDATMAAG
jgi:hypothetical protein